MVDYVIIDDNQSPLKLISLIKPKIFAKGNEYSNLENPKSIAEINTVKKFGGEVIFTPGDIIFSSSKIIKNKNINLNLEQIKSLMHDKKLNSTKLKSIIKKFKNISVNILGDSIVDEIINCSNNITQNKTPTLSLSYHNSSLFVGGAAVVALHLKSAGAKVNFFSILGKDKYASFLKTKLNNSKIKTNFLIKKKFITNLKKVYKVDKYSILKVSKTNLITLNNNDLQSIVSKIHNSKCDLMVFSDFRHGIFNQKNINFINNKLNKKITRIADSQVASRWGNISDFKNFDLITPNEKEARFATGDQDCNISMLSKKIIDQSKCKNLILKFGKNGSLSAKKINNKYEAYSLPALSTNDVDAVGTGDALLAYSSLAFKVTKCHATAHLMGVLAASCKVEKIGNEAVKTEDLIKKIDKIEEQMQIK